MIENAGSSLLVRRSTCTTGTGTCRPPLVSGRVLLSFLLLLILGQNEHKLLILASDPNAPHAHTGKQQPFSPGDPSVSLDRKALSILSSGKPFQTTIHVPGSTSGRGLVVQEVHAPPNVVWDRILDFDHYVDMVPRTFECKNYHVQKQKPAKRDALERTIFTKFKIGLPLIPKMTFYVKHLYYPSLNSLTWTLDYSKKSDFDDSVGYWYVVPHPHRSGWSRVYYSVAVNMYDWVPKSVVNFMSTKALTDATAWVKKFSEEKWRTDPRKTNVEALGGDDSAGVNSAKGRGLFGRTKKDRDVQLAGGTCDSSLDTCDNKDASYSASDTGEGNKPSKILTIKSAIVRIALLMTVSSLLVYNISLCLDRYTQS